MRFLSSTIMAATFALTSLASLSSAHADCSVNASNVPMCSGKIDDIYLHPKALFLNTDGDESKLSSVCTLQDNKYIRLASDNKLLDQYLSMAMAAKLSGSPILLRMQKGDDGICELVYAILQ